MTDADVQSERSFHGCGHNFKYVFVDIFLHFVVGNFIDVTKGYFLIRLVADIFF